MKFTGQAVIPIDPNKLRSERKKRGFSQYDLAKRAGVSRSFISDIEQGRKQPRQLTARAIALALGHVVEDLT